MGKQLLKLVVIDRFVYNPHYEAQKRAWDKAGRKASAQGLTCPCQTIETPAYESLLAGTFEIPQGWTLATSVFGEYGVRLLFQRSESDSAYRD
jgi:hypothetical protein